MNRRGGFAPAAMPAAGAALAAGAAGVGVCVVAGAGVVAPAGGATMGGAACSVAGRPLFAAKGEVPHVPTQCSGAGGAASADGMVKVRTTSAKAIRRAAKREGKRRFTAEINLGGNFSAAPSYAAPHLERTSRLTCRTNHISCSHFLFANTQRFLRRRRCRIRAVCGPPRCPRRY